jgi:hypothetical protein
MQLENASVELVDVELLPADELDPIGELDPHATIVVAAASAAAAVSSRAGRDGCAGSCIWSRSRPVGPVRLMMG